MLSDVKEWDSEDGHRCKIYLQDLIVPQNFCAIIFIEKACLCVIILLRFRKALLVSIHEMEKFNFSTMLVPVICFSMPKTNFACMYYLGKVVSVHIWEPVRFPIFFFPPCAASSKYFCFCISFLSNSLAHECTGCVNVFCWLMLVRIHDVIIRKTDATTLMRWQIRIGRSGLPMLISFIGPCFLQRRIDEVRWPNNRADKTRLTIQ